MTTDRAARTQKYLRDAQHRGHTPLLDLYYQATVSLYTEYLPQDIRAQRPTQVLIVRSSQIPWQHMEMSV